MAAGSRRAHYLAVYGRRRPAEMQLRTAVSERFMVRMRSSDQRPGRTPPTWTLPGLGQSLAPLAIPSGGVDTGAMVDQPGVRGERDLNVIRLSHQYAACPSCQLLLPLYDDPDGASGNHAEAGDRGRLPRSVQVTR